jgi:hypothetical protein
MSLLLNRKGALCELLLFHLFSFSDGKQSLQSADKAQLECVLSASELFSATGLLGVVTSSPGLLEVGTYLSRLVCSNSIYYFF